MTFIDLPPTSHNGRFSRIPGILSDFVALNIVIIPVILLLRIGQFISLSSLHSLPPGSWITELQGAGHDLFVWLFASWFLLLPFILLSLWKKWPGTLFFFIAFLFAAMTEWALFEYFRREFVPLDQVVFSYSARELSSIVSNSVRFDFIVFIPFILILILTLLAAWAARKITINRMIAIVFFLLFLAAAFFHGSERPFIRQESGMFRYAMAINKSAYFTGKILNYRKYAGRETRAGDIEAAASRYHAAHPELFFPQPAYPFLHPETTPDVLGPFLDLGKEEPNLVFVIVESLSSSFVGENPLFGSFTPFLDSLAGLSLWWSNYLATSDRTFNVLPAIFGSLPPGDPTFINLAAKIPYHLTMNRILRNHGYFTSFFYTGDATFNGMRDFLQRQETDYFLNYFGKNYKPCLTLTDGIHWGQPDHVLFARSLEVIDSVKRSPRLDIYLTLSMHAPFDPPGKERFLVEVDKRIAKMNPGNKLRKEVIKNRDIFASILYTDNSLQKFFTEYRKRPDFANTIFFITGDHALPELTLGNKSLLSRFNVPLIIYSPMLRRHAYLRSVSSHLDLAPSVLALMREKYEVKTPALVSWLGTGIDTSAAPVCRHSIPFILNSKEIIEYVCNSNYLFQNELYRILPDLSLKEINDPVNLKKISTELADFKVLNRYVTKSNRLIPREVYFDKWLDSIPVPLDMNPALNPNDSAGQFRWLLSNQIIPSGIKFIKLELTMDMKIREEDLNDAPILVFDLFGVNRKHLQWVSFDLPDRKLHTINSGGWRRLNITEYLELSYLGNRNNYSMMLYLWNNKHKQVRFKNPEVKITGFW